MARVNLNKATKEMLVEIDALVDAYKRYLKETLEYSEEECEIAASDMANPYDTEYVLQEYEGDYSFGDIDYAVYSCKTDFCFCGLFELADVRPFRFYMLFEKASMPDHTVNSYRKANKKFILVS